MNFLPLLIGGLTGGLSALFGGNESANNQQRAEKQQRQYMTDLYNKGTAAISQGKERSQVAINNLLSGQNSELTKLFSNIRKEARNATGALGTLGGSPEQSLVAPQINQLATTFGNNAMQLVANNEQNATNQELSLLDLLMKNTGDTFSPAASSSPFSNFFSGALGGAGLGSQIFKNLNSNSRSTGGNNNG